MITGIDILDVILGMDMRCENDITAGDIIEMLGLLSNGESQFRDRAIMIYGTNYQDIKEV